MVEDGKVLDLIVGDRLSKHGPQALGRLQFGGIRGQNNQLDALGTIRPVATCHPAPSSTRTTRISPDTWRRAVLKFETLGPLYKYAGMLPSQELTIVDRKLDAHLVC